MNRWERRIERLEAQARRDRERKAHLAEVVDQLSEDGGTHTFALCGPNGLIHTYHWTPAMGPWPVLAAKIDAADEAAHGWHASNLRLPQLMAEIAQIIRRAAAAEERGGGDEDASARA